MRQGFNGKDNILLNIKLPFMGKVVASIIELLVRRNLISSGMLAFRTLKNINNFGVL